MTGFRVRAATRVGGHGFFSVDELEVAGPDGGVVVRTVVRHPGAVVVVPVLDDGATALLVRQFRAATGGEVLEVPAGKRDVAGEPTAKTATRELAEEIGRTPARLVKLAECWNSPGFTDEYSHVYLALGLGAPSARAGVTAEERAMTVEPVALAAVERLVGTRRLVDAKSIVGLLLARSYLAGDHAALPEPW